MMLKSMCNAWLSQIGMVKNRAPSRERIEPMIFVVDLLQGTVPSSLPKLIHSIEFEADDLFSVVERTRIILESNDFEPVVDAFQISAARGGVIYKELRGSMEPHL